MDVNNTRIQSYIAYWKSVQTNAWVELGITETGTPEFMADGAYVNLEDADQFFGRIASQKVGFEVMCRIVLKEVSYADLYSRIMQGQVYPVVDGTSRAYDGDTVPVNMNRDVAGELRLVPTGAAASDSSEYITIWKAAPQLKLKLAGDRTKYQTVEVEFLAYPDPSRLRPGYPFSAAYFRLGDPLAIDSDPDYIGAVFGDQPTVPYKHTPAFSIQPGDTKKTFWYGAWREDATGTEACSVTTTSAHLATDTTIAYTGKTVASESLTGRYLRTPAGEILYVVNDAIATPTTGTLTVKRAALFSVAAAMSAGDTLAKQAPASIAVLPITDRASYASSAPGVATVGNSNTSPLPFGDKGLVTHVSAGTTNITATVGVTTSANLVVTAL